MARVKVTLTLDAEVADAARALGLNMSRLAGTAIAEATPGLNPVVGIGGTAWIVRVRELAAVPGADLRDAVGSLAAGRDALKQAPDILTDGL